MSQSIEFYYDIGSPYSYLAWHRLNQLCENHGASLDLHPVSIKGIFQETGNRPPTEVEAKARYLRRDIDRYANRYRCNFTLNPHFPIGTTRILSMAHRAKSEGKLHEFTHAFFEAMWSDGKNLGDEDVCRSVLADAGLDPNWVESGADPSWKEALEADTRTAIERGVFGVPTMFANGEMLFGQDRIWVIDELLGSVSPF